MKSQALASGDIVRYRKHFLALVTHAWESSLAGESGRLVSLEYLEHDLDRVIGRQIRVADAASVEFVARGIPPDAAVEELGIWHPWIIATEEAGRDAYCSLLAGIPLCQALQGARQRVSESIGDVPAGWVEMAVARTYSGDANIGMTGAP